ncbi:MAG: sugar ABC transporter permease [Anaerolineae bacterium]|nr:sugar ABC transporter permease [Anaerolineae bacterium]MDW8071673.1 sugar ABC transporter permease [Anaerolineae bacterium]
MTAIAEEIVSDPALSARGNIWRSIARELKENHFPYLLLIPSILCFIALVIYPLASTIIGAFSKTDTVGRAVEFGALLNFRELVRDRYILNITIQTAIFVFGSVALTVVLSLPLALILNQRFPGAALARALLLMPWAAPLAISAMTWRWIFHDQLGALNYVLNTLNITQARIAWLSDPVLAFICVIFVEVWSSIPFMTIMFLAGLQSIPPHIYDAAKMDGANAWHEFWDMTLPQLKRITTIVTLLSIIWAFRSFNVIWPMTQGNPFFRTDNSVTYLYKLAFRSLSFGEGYALAFATFVFLLIFSVVYTRVLRSEEG